MRNLPVACTPPVLTALAFVPLLALLETDADGRWHPGIGDPTALGWITVVAYFAAALLCLQARPRARRAALPRLVSFWTLLGLLLLALGVNKQLDLQSLLTQVARDLAKSQGWYKQRATVQVEFIVALVVCAAATLGASLWFLRDALARVRVAFAGMLLLATFVVVRAASFHHMDRLLKWEFLHLRMNAILELGGIALVALGAWRFRPEISPDG